MLTPISVQKQSRHCYERDGGLSTSLFQNCHGFVGSSPSINCDTEWSEKQVQLMGKIKETGKWDPTNCSSLAQFALFVCGIIGLINYVMSKIPLLRLVQTLLGLSASSFQDQVFI